MTVDLWGYRAKLQRVIDGDTIDVTVDLGFSIEHTIRLRLAGINTPEVRGIERVEGKKATQFVVEWLQSAESINPEWPLIVQTKKTGKYGRWIARVYDSGSEKCLNDAIDEAGFNKTHGYGPGMWS
jgi:micrococcal nuclease